MLTIQSEHLDDKTLRVTFGDVILFDYHYREKAETHLCPRPFMHPIRTLAGDTLTNSRPADHPWHNGLSMTLNHVNGMNFWGGPTYRKETGSYEYYPNVGKQVHREWLPSTESNHSQSWIEIVDWFGPEEEHVLVETRTLTVRDINPDIGMWRLHWESSLTNVLRVKLAINSYQSGEGLQGSGYTGLFLRMSRGFTRAHPQIFTGNRPDWDDYHDSRVIIPSVESINGWKSNRLAYQGIFDTSLNGALLLCEDLTINPLYELHWFHRPEFPYLAWSTAFHKTLFLDKNSTIQFHHAIGIVNGFWKFDSANDLWAANVP